MRSPEQNHQFIERDHQLINTDNLQQLGVNSSGNLASQSGAANDSSDGSPGPHQSFDVVVLIKQA